MQINLAKDEIDEAVKLWLEHQGFSSERFNVDSRIIVGRGDNSGGTRIEATLTNKVFDKIGAATTAVYHLAMDEAINEQADTTASRPKLFGGAE